MSDSYRGPIDPIVQRIYDAIRELDVDPSTPAEAVIDAIELAFERHGTPANVVRCAFCGQAYPSGTPATKHQALTEHILQCSQHPLQGVIAERDRLLQAIETIRDMGHECPVGMNRATFYRNGMQAMVTVAAKAAGGAG